MSNPTLATIQGFKPQVDLQGLKQVLDQPVNMNNPFKDELDRQAKIKKASNLLELQREQFKKDILVDRMINPPKGNPSAIDNKDLLDYIASYESSGYTDPYKAVNKKSGAFGRYQFIPKYAEPYADKLGVTVDDMRTDPNLQDTAAKLKLQDLQRELASYGIPVTKQNIYLGWQEGAKGLYDLMQGKLPGGSYKALDLNLPKGIDRTPEAFLDYWYKRL